LFVDDCKRANDGTAEAQSAVRELLERAICDPGGVWPPLMLLLPHEHNTWSLIGIYTGREDNIFWERRAGRVSAVRASAISQGAVHVADARFTRAP
jgi:hypothetical protein